MRLGGPVFVDHSDMDAFIRAHKEKGYRAAYCPDGLKPGQAGTLKDLRESLSQNDLIIAEVGAWCNPLANDSEEAKKNIHYVIDRLALAEELGARACVNIIGTWYDGNWYGPCAENFRQDFFDYAVEVSRKIVDAVNPRHTKMTFEIMPFSFLDSAVEYLRFLKALDREGAGIHYDPANCINCPRLLYNNAEFIRDSLEMIGPGVLSIHLKDLTLRPEPLNVEIIEVPIGKGQLDYVSMLKNIAKLPADTPVMLEHLPSEADYDEAAANLRLFADKAGVVL